MLTLLTIETTQADQERILSSLYSHLHNTIEPMIEHCRESGDWAAVDYWRKSAIEQQRVIRLIKDALP